MEITREQAIKSLIAGNYPSEDFFKMAKGAGTYSTRNLYELCKSRNYLLSAIREDDLKALGVTQEEIDNATR